LLNRDAIARRIPHQGSMCLLEQVVAWSPERIHCVAHSHRDPDNPLRAHGRLGIACGIEYAAQAMAVHGALVAQGAEAAPATPRVGYLASVRGVAFHARRLDDVAGDLSVHAERVLGDGSHIVYSFAVEAGGQPLLSGRATVVLDAGMATRLGMPSP
jgi:predicted hotdog family 3-hydroxylacyl-ACP dehydratase